MLAAPRLPLLSSSYRPPLRTHTHCFQQGLSRCLGRAAGMPPPGLGRVGWMEFSPGEVEEVKAEVYLPSKSLLCSLVLALAPGRLRIRFPLFKSPSSSFIRTSDQGQGSLGAGFRSDPRLLCLHQTLVKSSSVYFGFF